NTQARKNQIRTWQTKLMLPPPVSAGGVPRLVDKERNQARFIPAHAARCRISSHWHTIKNREGIEHKLSGLTLPWAAAASHEGLQYVLACGFTSMTICECSWKPPFLLQDLWAKLLGDVTRARK